MDSWITGVEGLQAKLNLLKKSQAKAAIRKGCRAGAKIVQAKAQELAPVKTGQLRAAIKVRSIPRSKNWTGVSIRVDNSNAFYFSFIEYGLTTRKLEGRHFLKDAADQSKDEAISMAIETIKAEIERSLQT